MMERLKEFTVVCCNESSRVDRAAWTEANAVGTLNVAGPRASKVPLIYDEATAFLGRLLNEAA